MEYDRLPKRVQALDVSEIARSILFHLDQTLGAHFDYELAYQDEKVRDAVNDAVYYLVLYHLYLNKNYPIVLNPLARFMDCCNFILIFIGYNDLKFSDEDEDIMEFIQDNALLSLENIDVGDKWDLWEVKVKGDFIKIYWCGDYRIEMYHFLEENGNLGTDKKVVYIDDSHTLLERYRRRDRVEVAKRHASESGHTYLHF